jgi:hypothetical protein
VSTAASRGSARHPIRGEVTTEDATPQTTFVRGNDHLDRLLSDPRVTADVAEASAAAEEMDRAYGGPAHLSDHYALCGFSAAGS